MHQSATRISIAAILVGVFIFSLAARMLGPSDIYDNHQTRTIAYTADMLLHGRWTMPRDPTGMPAKKPPAYNWISVPFVTVFGYREWALKMPSILATAGTVWIIVLAARGMFSQSSNEDDEKNNSQQANEIALLSALFWLANSATFKLAYTARPDMLLVFFMAMGWLCAMKTLEEKSRENKTAAWWALGMWIAAAGAGVTKGPIGLLIPLYALLASKWIHNAWSRFHRTQWWWGAPVMFGLVACWLVPAYLQEPTFFREMLIDRELANRVHRGGLLKVIGTAWEVEFYFITRLFPWSIPAIAAFFMIPWRKWRAHPTAPALLWTLLILVVFTCISAKRSDRFAPVYPAACVLAAYVMIELKRIASKPPLRFFAGKSEWLAVAFCVIITINNQWFSSWAKTQFGSHVKTFAAEISKNAGHDPIVFFGVSDTPLQTLLGINQAGAPTPEALEKAAWIVRPYDGDDSYVALSEKIPDVRPEKIGIEAKVALYRNTPQQRARLPKYDDSWNAD